MVWVPGSSGDLGFHRKSQEDVKMKEGLREEVPKNVGSIKTSLNTTRSSDQQSSGRISTDRYEEALDQDPDLEEKPRIPPMVASAATADLDENPDPYATDKETTKPKSNPFTKSVAATRPSKKKKKIKAAGTKLKAPDSESEAVNRLGSPMAKDMIEQAYYRKVRSETLLQTPVLTIIQVRQIGDLTGPVSKPRISADRLNAICSKKSDWWPGNSPDSLFEMELGTIQSTTQDLFHSLKIPVGVYVQMSDLN
ncbi:hypothetical protein PHMEG_00039127 [Phytophthora megakarya]|uniref:Uncharacterized protein n=1 Tax=Phytophthora megakarya TaxID=4795 RepID=A0A225UGH1_9STRA|nr:hypothetical protein PHMEG_00039127 [Phytophthora megakarya]